jgi:alginate O-acetyltransferase complex protein AlgI
MDFIFIFLPATFFIYFYLNKKRLTEIGKGWLFFSTLLFFSWWDINYLLIIWGSVLFNYFLGYALYLGSNEKKISSQFNKKKIFIFGTISNLSLLGYFKSVDIFIENINLAFNPQIMRLSNHSTGRSRTIV